AVCRKKLKSKSTKPTIEWANPIDTTGCDDDDPVKAVFEDGTTHTVAGLTVKEYAEMKHKEIKNHIFYEGKKDKTTRIWASPYNRKGQQFLALWQRLDGKRLQMVIQMMMKPHYKYEDGVKLFQSMGMAYASNEKDKQALDDQKAQWMQERDK
ncbi:unnamed protein product, partial [Prorocentrum cordatum]